MTSLEFMERNKGTKPSYYRGSYEKRCSSILLSRDGNFYSYGYHYPLLFEVDGLWFVNDRGYSSSTRKHISWARTLADHSVESSGDITKNGVLADLENELKSLRSEFAKHRAGTKICERIGDHIVETLQAIKAITS